MNGWVVSRFGVRIPMVAGFLVDALGFSLLLLLGSSSAYWLALPAFILMPAGMGHRHPRDDRRHAGQRRPLGLGSRRSRDQCGASGRGCDRSRGLRCPRGNDLVGGMHAAAILSAILLVATGGRCGRVGSGARIAAVSPVRAKRRPKGAALGSVERPGDACAWKRWRSA